MVPSGGDPAPDLQGAHLARRDTVSRSLIGLIDTFDQFLFIGPLIVGRWTSEMRHDVSQAGRPHRVSGFAFWKLEFREQRLACKTPLKTH